MLFYNKALQDLMHHGWAVNFEKNHNHQAPEFCTEDTIEKNIAIEKLWQY